MNVMVKLVMMWYLFLTFLAIFASINIPVSDVIPGLILIWLVFISFFLGSSLNTLSTVNTINMYPVRAKKTKVPLILIAVGSIIASLYAVKFYTGNSLLTIISVIQERGSLYNQYQSYFNQNNLGEFSVNKIPAILSLLYLKLATLTAFIYVIVLSPKIIPKHCFYLSIISCSVLFFSMARGTSFELFELMMLLLFSIVMRSFVLNKKKISTKAKIVLFSLASLAIMIYSYNISARYSFGQVSLCSTHEFCFSEDTLIYQIIPSLAKLSYKLSSYFTFGIFYTSKFIEDFWFSSVSHLISLILPFAIADDPDLNLRLLCDTTLDCAAAWVPDIVNYLLHIGLLILLMVAFLLGVLANYLLRIVFTQHKFLEIFALYFILLAFISPPVGSFIAVSSSNKLTIVIIVLGLIIDRWLNHREIIRRINSVET